VSYVILTKHQALGNDFLVTFHPPVDDLAAFARWVCHRRRGIGADGLLVGYDEPGRAPTMVLYNADGSLAEMSGNGIRCFAQAVAERCGSYQDLTILTGAGERHVQFVSVRGLVVEAAVSMGVPQRLPAPRTWANVGADRLRPVEHLSMGNPHTVVAVDDVGSVDLAAIGSLVADVNLEIIEVGPRPGEITMRVHERGAGITEACGTGACAAAVAAYRWGLVDRKKIVVHMDGGDATVTLPDDDDGPVILQGPATLIATITVQFPHRAPSDLDDTIE